MSIKIHYDENNDLESIEIDSEIYFYEDVDEVFIPRDAITKKKASQFPIGIYVNIFDHWDNNVMVYESTPFKLMQHEQNYFTICFDETNTRKYWYATTGLESWMKIRCNILKKLYNAKVDHYEDDGAYIQFNYSIEFESDTFNKLFDSIDNLVKEVNLATEIASTSPNITLEYNFYKELYNLREMLCENYDMRKLLTVENKTEFMFNLYKTKLSNIIERHLRETNPDKLLLEYRTLFATKTFSKKIIRSGEKYYRGRIGYETIKGAIGGCNKEFTVPYNCKDIDVAPSLYTSGGRFNRAGTSYIYLATDIETCLAEVHLQVGQKCSIGEFESTEEIELINLSDYGDDLELKAWYEIITQPVHDSIKFKYLITQFMSEVLMQFNSNGLYFKSVQSEGENIVCFRPDKFKLVKYSEKLYVANKIKYSFSQIEDDIQIYAKRDDTHLINYYNSDDDDRNQMKIEYMDEWINNEKLKNKTTK